MQMGEYQSVKDFLLRGLPDFCWQDLHEIQTMAEKINENVDDFNLKTQLCNLVKLNRIDIKLVSGRARLFTKGNLHHYKYKRKS